MKNTYCKLGYMADEKQLLPGINIRAAMLDKLALHAIECLGKDRLALFRGRKTAGSSKMLLNISQ